ncbi:alpha-glucuronidase family glycosyl hydrolase [Alteromonadaceae bacterium BrNp21-10]|nr:alpha-glucuronidase family glycosyl hydrolase [Alteromonadaceae bacterium BrNp21-10]
MLRLVCVFLLLLSQVAVAQNPFAGDDGYRLWLKYDEITDKQQRQSYVKSLTAIDIRSQSDTANVIQQELTDAWQGLLKTAPHFSSKADLIITKGDQLSKNEQSIQTLLSTIGNEGFVIHSLNGKTYIAANSDIGLLYGTFRFLRLLQTEQSIKQLSISESPKVQLRMLNHWDDLDRHTERGYAGQSIFDWHKLPDYKEQRYYDYARANASIGINGIVPNNVNANSLILTPHYLQKVKALADIFRPYGIKVYLSLKFSSPQQIGGLSTSDPLDKNVQQWWKDKTAEIYKIIPDFGGYLVKANSEGQPGPGDYGRTHAEGANMLAKALQPFGGNVLWRAFVYSHDAKAERSLQAYNEFVPLDGKFEPNVSVQVKNGPIDFQPREAFSALFGATPQTSLAMEFQITQEYLGFSTHLAYLGTMYKEALDADTHVKGEGSTVAKVVDGSLYNIPLSAMAGVANIGMDRNWTGHIFGQSNWYVYGRLAWDHDLTAAEIAEEWARMTLSNDDKAVANIVDIMMSSREHVVNYMTPLGLHHLMDTGHHYGPGPWVGDLGRDDWNPTYYHRADEQGIGLDRTASGTNGVAQYAPYWQKRFSDPATTPTELLLWFHHLDWDYKMPSGDTLWNELAKHYDAGVQGVAEMQAQWLALESQIEANQFNQVKMALAIQLKEAQWWRDACMLYFQTFSKRPFPAGFAAPEHSLETYRSYQFPYAPGRG